MKTMLFVVTLMAAILLPAATLQAQDDQGVTFTFAISNSAGRSDVVSMGLRAGATTGLDQTMGEYELPPVPPSGVFDVRMLSTPGKSQLGLGSKCDFRAIGSTTLPFTETYTVGYQAGEGQNSVKLVWDKPLPSRIQKITADGVDISGLTEINTSFAQGQITVVFTYNYKPLGFTVNPTSLSFIANNIDPLPSKTLEITPTGDTEAAWAITATSLDWIDVTPSSGNGHTTVTVSVNTGVLATGSYSGTLTVSALSEPVSVNVPVTLQFVVGVEPVSAPSGMALYETHPNPAYGPTLIELDAGTAKTVHLAIHDMLGRVVADLSSDVRAQSGRQFVSFDASSLPAGVYTCRLSDGRYSLARNLVVIP